MYSLPTVSITESEKGLGFDFGGLIENVTKIGTNIYQQTMQLKQAKVMAQAGLPVGMSVPVGTLPSAGFYNPMSNVPQPMLVPQQTGMSTGTMLLVGGIVVGGVLLAMYAKR